jgi:hypothetical protein
MANHDTDTEMTNRPPDTVVPDQDDVDMVGPVLSLSIGKAFDNITEVETAAPPPTRTSGLVS